MKLLERTFYSPYIVKLSLLLMKSADQMLAKKYNLTHSQFMIMIVLHECEQLSQVALAEKLNLTGAAISRSVSILTQKKFLRRAEDPSNRRQNLLQLTKEGKRVILGAIELLMAMEQKLYGTLDQTQLATFVTVCDHLSQRLLKKSSPI